MNVEKTNTGLAASDVLLINFDHQGFNEEIPLMPAPGDHLLAPETAEGNNPFDILIDDTNKYLGDENDPFEIVFKKACGKIKPLSTEMPVPISEEQSKGTHGVFFNTIRNSCSSVSSQKQDEISCITSEHVLQLNTFNTKSDYTEDSAKQCGIQDKQLRGQSLLTDKTNSLHPIIEHILDSENNTLNINTCQSVGTGNCDTNIKEKNISHRLLDLKQAINNSNCGCLNKNNSEMGNVLSSASLNFEKYSQRDKNQLFSGIESKVDVEINSESDVHINNGKQHPVFSENIINKDIESVKSYVAERIEKCIESARNSTRWSNVTVMEENLSHRRSLSVDHRKNDCQACPNVFILPAVLPLGSSMLQNGQTVGVNNINSCGMPFFYNISQMDPGQFVNCVLQNNKTQGLLIPDHSENRGMGIPRHSRSNSVPNAVLRQPSTTKCPVLDLSYKGRPLEKEKSSKKKLFPVETQLDDENFSLSENKEEENVNFEAKALSRIFQYNASSDTSFTLEGENDVLSIKPEWDKLDLPEFEIEKTGQVKVGSSEIQEEGLALAESLPQTPPHSNTDFLPKLCSTPTSFTKSEDAAPKGKGVVKALTMSEVPVPDLPIESGKMRPIRGANIQAKSQKGPIKATVPITKMAKMFNQETVPGLKENASANITAMPKTASNTLQTTPTKSKNMQTVQTGIGLKVPDTAGAYSQSENLSISNKSYKRNGPRLSFGKGSVTSVASDATQQKYIRQSKSTGSLPSMRRASTGSTAETLKSPLQRKNGTDDSVKTSHKPLNTDSGLKKMIKGISPGSKTNLRRSFLSSGKKENILPFK